MDPTVGDAIGQRPGVTIRSSRPCRSATEHTLHPFPANYLGAVDHIVRRYS
jgi:hypothetical protein